MRRLLFLVAWVLVLATGNALAQDGDIGVKLTPEGIFGSLISIIVALLVGYARGIKKQCDDNAHEIRSAQSQISLLRETMPHNYYTKLEARELQATRDLHTAEHRERMESGLADVKECMSHMSKRFDSLQRATHRRMDDET